MAFPSKPKLTRVANFMKTACQVANVAVHNEKVRFILMRISIGAINYITVATIPCALVSASIVSDSCLRFCVVISFSLTSSSRPSDL